MTLRTDVIPIVLAVCLLSLPSGVPGADASKAPSEKGKSLFDGGSM